MARSTNTTATTTTLIVQHIHIMWTKAARGGSLAERRNQIPKAFTIPQPPTTYDRHDHYIVHCVNFGERNDFAEPVCSQTTAPSVNTSFLTTNCTVELTNGMPEVIYEWRDGAPERQFFDKSGMPIPVRKRLPVHPGKWVRVEYNGRFSGVDCGNWWYEHSIINVAYAAPDRHDMLLTTDPDAVFQQLEHLW